MSDSEPPKCKPGSLAHATFRLADAEKSKVEEASKWRVIIERLVNWITKKE